MNFPQLQLVNENITKRMYCYLNIPTEFIFMNNQKCFDQNIITEYWIISLNKDQRHDNKIKEVIFEVFSTNKTHYHPSQDQITFASTALIFESFKSIKVYKANVYHKLE